MADRENSTVHCMSFIFFRTRAARITGIFFRPSCFLDLFVSAMFRLFRAVARFFVTGVAGGGGESIIASAEGTNLVGGSGGILPRKIFKFGIFSTCHEICLLKIDLKYENGKQL